MQQSSQMPDVYGEDGPRPSMAAGGQSPAHPFALEVPQLLADCLEGVLATKLGPEGGLEDNVENIGHNSSIPIAEQNTKENKN